MSSLNNKAKRTTIIDTKEKIIYGISKTKKRYHIIFDYLKIPPTMNIKKRIYNKIIKVIRIFLFP